MNYSVVQLAASQIPAASEILGAAFQNDPVFINFACSDSQRRLNTIQWMSRLMLQYAHHYHSTYTTIAELKGVAIWIPPGQFPLHDLRLLYCGAYALPWRFRFSKLLQFMQLFLKIEELHRATMPELHWYLLMLGVHPDYQSQGVGGSLLQPILAQADQENFPCYLETSTEQAVHFYQRYNFVVIETINIPQSNGQIWTMRRDPHLKTNE
jgi:ribosomal protein S18 acetylase RimI-like enzyme